MDPTMYSKGITLASVSKKEVEKGMNPRSILNVYPAV